MQNVPRVNVTRPVRPLTQATAELMSTRRPVVSGPYGLDADIEPVVFLPKTFKEKKADEDRLQRSTMPPRLPMETNLNTLYRSATKKDFVKYDIIPMQTPEQVCNFQKAFTKKLAKPKNSNETQQKKKLSISFYSKEDAERDKRYMEERRNKYDTFVREKTMASMSHSNDVGWR